jgi:hypothetical protein
VVKHLSFASVTSFHAWILQLFDCTLASVTSPNTNRRGAKISHLVTGLSLTSCVRTACPKLSTSLEQLVNSCNKLVDIIRLVARLFQQIRYSHYITILLQPCVVNLQ